jgi:hypothetical protein
MDTKTIVSKLREAVMAIESVSDVMQDEGTSVIKTAGWMPSNFRRMAMKIAEAGDRTGDTQLATMRRVACEAIAEHCNAEPSFEVVLLKTLSAEKVREPAVEKKPFALPPHLGKFVRAVAEVGNKFETLPHYNSGCAIPDLADALAEYCKNMPGFREVILKKLV